MVNSFTWMLNIQFFEDAVVHGFVLAGAKLVAFGVDLDAAHGVLDLEERDSSHDALGHDTTGDADILEFAVVFRKFLQNLCGSGIYLIFRCRIRIDSKIQQIL